MRKLVLLAVMTAACAHTPPEIAVARSSDEHAVQSVVLNDVVTVVPGARSVVVLDSTVMGWGHYYPGDDAAAYRELGTLAPGLSNDFAKKRGQKVPVLPPTVAGRVIMVSTYTIASLPARDPGEFWNAFRTRFPGSFGYVRFSRAGFSSDGKQALVVADYACGGRCGGTRFYLLERTATGWRIANMSQPRIS